MKKFVLFILLAGFISLAYGQKLEEGFEAGAVPDTWTVHDYGHNPDSFRISENFPHEGSYHVEVDTYEADSTNDGQADDWLITPQITVNDGDVLSFWAASGNEDFLDGVDVKISTSGTAVDDFTIEAGSHEVPYNYTKFTHDLISLDGISNGDAIYIGFHCNTNGSGLNMDDFYVGQPQTVLMQKAWALSDSSVAVMFDAPVVADDITLDDFQLKGSEEIAFTDFATDADNQNLVHLWSSNLSMSQDRTVDSLIHAAGEDTQDTVVFYGGITPIAFANTTHPDGVLEDSITATFKGRVMAKAASNQMFVSNGTGARNSILTYGASLYDVVDVGDEILFYGERGTYNNHTQIEGPELIKTYSTGNEVFDPTVVSSSDLDMNIAKDADPAEQYESVFVKLENMLIKDTMTNQYGDFYYLATAGEDTVRIGNRMGFFEGGFQDSIMKKGQSYDITGFVAGMYGDWEVSPRNVFDAHPLNDDTKPVVTYDAQTLNNSPGQEAIVTSSEYGKLYLVMEGEDQASVADFDVAVKAHKGAMAQAKAGKGVAISTFDLLPGSYNAYAVDRSGNISDKGANAVTIEDYGKPLPFTEDFEDEKVIPSSFMLVNGDGLDPDGTDWDALKDSAWIVTYRNSFESNVAMGISYYSGDVSYADDWLILPKLQLGSNSMISWEAMSLTVSGDFPDDYEVLVSATTSDTAAFESVLQIEGEAWSPDSDTPGEGIQQHGLNLADEGYADQAVYIAFRLNTPHPGGDRLALDNLIVAQADETAPEVSVDAQTVDIGNDVMIQSSEATGKVYLILDGEAQATVEDLETAVTNQVGASAEVAAANTDMAVSTTNLVAGTYHAYAVDSAQNMSAKSGNAVTLQSTTAIEKASADKFIAVYPNPVSNHATVALGLQDAGTLTMELTNVHGSKVMARQENYSGKTNVHFNVSDLSNGIYMLRIYTSEATLVKRIIVR